MTTRAAAKPREGTPLPNGFPHGPLRLTGHSSAFLYASEARPNHRDNRPDGVEGRRGERAVRERLGVDSYSPDTDARPTLTPNQPEVREYRLRFIRRDEPVGDWSDIVTVTVTP